jgi:hypothetical protein
MHFTQIKNHILLLRLLIHFQQLPYRLMKKRETQFLADTFKNRESLQQNRRRL